MVLLRAGCCSGPVGKHRSQAVHQEDARPRSAVVGQLGYKGYNLYSGSNARRGGNVAGVARKALEAETGKPVVTAQNTESFRQLVTDIVTDAAQLPEKKETANEE